jgi:hypothetical protein
MKRGPHWQSGSASTTQRSVGRFSGNAERTDSQIPGTYQGNSTHLSSATLWTAAASHSPGDLVTASPSTGQVFICVQGGTTAGSQPSWSSPPFPTIGTTFNDNTVIWMMYGTQPGAFAPIIQTPVDSDPPLAGAQVIPEQTLADQLAWISLSAGLLAASNTWTGTNTFEGAIITIGANSTFLGANTDTGGILTLGGTPTVRRMLLKIPLRVVSGPQTIYARFYSDSVNSFDSSGAGLAITVNASWNGTNWQYDSSSLPASRWEYSTIDFTGQSYPASSTSPWSDSAWTAQFNFVTGPASSPAAYVPSLEITGPGNGGAGVGLNQGFGLQGFFGVPSVLYTNNNAAGPTAQHTGITGATTLISQTPSYPAGTGGAFHRIVVSAIQTSGSGGSPTATFSWQDLTAGSQTGTVNMTQIGSSKGYHASIEVFNTIGGTMSAAVTPGSGTFSAVATIEALA